MLTCAQCEHYKHDPADNDLTRRVCFGGPPQVINMPVRTAQGQGIAQVMVRPGPDPTTPACGAFKFKLMMASANSIDAAPIGSAV